MPIVAGRLSPPAACLTLGAWEASKLKPRFPAAARMRTPLPGRSVDRDAGDQSPVWACMAVMTTLLTMSATRQPRLRSLTVGLRGAQRW